MKIIQFNSTGGASGDMILGALAGLGADMNSVNSQIAEMLPAEKFKINIAQVSRNGIAGLQASVDIHEQNHHHHHEEHEEKAAPHHKHEHHGHEHSHEEHKPHRHEHHHRSFRDIKKIITGSLLPEKAKELSMKVFTLIAEAEAKIHSTTPDEVHFHEVGAVDSIVDITGACLAFTMLDVDAINYTPLPLGQGTVKCQHGIYPSPAPATVELLKGLPVYQTNEPFELITPTGAALLKGLPYAEIPFGSEITKTSYSFGHRELNERPNLLRAMLFEKVEAVPDTDTCSLLETNIDDISPQIIGALFTKLFKSGALDVFTTPINMKKQRSAILLSVLCKIQDKEKFEELIFTETSTFGIRETIVTRKILIREFKDIDTEYGIIKVKIGTFNGRKITGSPEYDDCLKAAEKYNVPLKNVFNAVIRKLENFKI